MVTEKKTGAVIMRGISLDQEVAYKHASFRYFDENEHHVTRTCAEDVLLLVFDGVLRFSENGKEYEVCPGEYHIQQHNSFQEGKIASSSPKYLYVHFYAEWDEESHKGILPYRGEFSVEDMEASMKRLDLMAHNDYTQVEQAAVFYEILSKLYRKGTPDTHAEKIAAFIEENYQKNLTLEIFSKEFHFSKNHIINMFRKEYGITPFEYLKNVRIKKARWFLEVTPETAENIARECGFADYSYFYRVFRESTGLSPAEWRKRKRLKPYGE